MAQEKRYVVVMDMYVYAADDQAAKKEAERLAKELDDKYGNRAQVTELGEQPFASMSFRKIDL